MVGAGEGKGVSPLRRRVHALESLVVTSAGQQLLLERSVQAGHHAMKKEQIPIVLHRRGHSTSGPIFTRQATEFVRWLMLRPRCDHRS